MTLDQSLAAAQGLDKWLEHHGCKLERLGPNTVGVRIPIICKHLVFDDRTGLASCAIYEQRPAICRDHWCRRAK